MQVGNTEHVFLFDMLTMPSIPKFDELMSEVFRSKTIVGMSFSSDIDALKKSFSTMEFFKVIPHLYDVQTIYAGLYGENELGLAKITENVTKKKVCKVEQTGNWERRPLRPTQIHYSAMHSFILVHLYNVFVEEANKQKKNLNRYKTRYAKLSSEEITHDKVSHSD